MSSLETTRNLVSKLSWALQSFQFIHPMAGLDERLLSLGILNDLVFGEK